MVYKDIDKKLQANGWVKVRVHGSHNMYKHPDHTACLSVPGHGKDSVSKGVIRVLERETGLSFR